ncbi:MAG: hypothetical protein ABSF54_03070 [Bryobacteraceae bacterium]
MSAFGIVVEGPRDAAVYPVIIRRIRPDIERVVARPCGGIPALPNKFVGWLKHFQYEHLIDKALVIRDSDWKNPHVLEAELSDRLRKSGFEPTFPVHFYATRSMVETWLMADEQAVSKVALTRGRTRSIKPIGKPLEEFSDPKTLFQAMLSEASLPADDRVYKEIASAADLYRIAERCPRFAEFREHVHAC